MTDETITEETPDATPAVAESGAPATTGAAEVAEAPKVRWIDRPYVERYLVPLFLPLIVILFVVVYVLNISRLFLSGHGHIPVIAGTIITCLILLGSTLLSASAHRLRNSALVLVGAGFLLAIFSGGWLVLGHSQEGQAAITQLPANLKTKQTLTVTAAPAGALKFVPDSLTAKTGLATIDVKVASGGHTFTFDEASTLFGTLTLSNSGETVKGVAYFAKAGPYTFYCTIPGHRAAGMQGTVNVTGPDVPTLDAALKAAGDTTADLKS